MLRFFLYQLRCLPRTLRLAWPTFLIAYGIVAAIIFYEGDRAVGLSWAVVLGLTAVLFRGWAWQLREFRRITRRFRRLENRRVALFHAPELAGDVNLDEELQRWDRALNDLLPVFGRGL